MRITETTRELFDAARQQGRDALDEPTAKRILNLYGMQTPRSLVVEGPAVSEAQLLALGGTVALKLMSPDVLHKSDFGGVVLGLRDIEGIQLAMQTMADRCHEHGYQVDGFLIEEQIPPGHELVIGGFQDSTFGPVVMLGLGGIFVEVLKDVSFRLCPITEIDASEMLQELQGAALLRGARGGVSVPEQIVIDALMSVGGAQGLFFQLSDDIRELDINPLFVSPEGAVALDARMVLV